MTLQEVNAKNAFSPEEYKKCKAWNELKKSRGEDYEVDIIKALVIKWFDKQKGPVWTPY